MIHTQEPCGLLADALPLSHMISETLIHLDLVKKTCELCCKVLRGVSLSGGIESLQELTAGTKKQKHKKNYHIKFQKVADQKQISIFYGLVQRFGCARARMYGHAFLILLGIVTTCADT